MSDKMTPIGFIKLVNWIVKEYSNHQTVFGIPSQNFYTSKTSSKLSIFDDSLDTLIGPAAGPHTQLAQNIVCSYLVGGRFMELKTVQILDNLEIAKPCIDASDECYNTEWSQELTLEQSFDEYLKSWILLHLIKEVFNLSNSPQRGFIFNMSVGYDLKGIQSPRMDDFIDKLKNANKSPLFDEYKKDLKDKLIKLNTQSIPGKIPTENLINKIDNISAQICNSVTLSTMHGCPPQEIEAIAEYMIKEKELHTYVKLNPTLLGYNSVNKLLKETGYHYIKMDRGAFENDLQLKDAIPMLKRLKKLAASQNKAFGIKLSNTLGIKNTKKVLAEENMYMSGRSLYPLTIHLAYQLANTFNGDINISYSGGATAFNINSILESGIYPVTLVTDLLKPGGYFKLKQMAENAEFIAEIPDKINLDKLKTLVEDVLNSALYKKENREIKSIKIPKSLPLTDCYIAPCVEACPIKQDVPEYIRLVEQKKYVEALNLIYDKNPLPHITGYICDHQCQYHCTRWDYENPLMIRRIKREAAEKGYDQYLQNVILSDSEESQRSFGPILPQDDMNVSIAIIGAGPSGLSAAYFLAKTGFNVTVFEKNNEAGGVVQHVIPEFRLPQSAIDKDVEFIEQLGVTFKFNCSEHFSVKKLQSQDFKYIYLAIGAEKAKRLLLEKRNDRVLNAIEFLRDYRKNVEFDLGKNVAVVGGGNTAMDGARAAIRCQGVENVYILYRRTKEFMPADLEEFNAAIEDGIIYKELLLPVEFSDGKLKCNKMQLGEKEPDGRRKVTTILNEFEEYEIDTVISAIGEMVNPDLLIKNNIVLDEKGNVIVNPETNETKVENVFIGGDALRGPSTVVESIADGRKVADAIIEKEKLPIQLNQTPRPRISEKEINFRKSHLNQQSETNIGKETERCLNCDYICNKCVDVCPNRANVAIEIEDGRFKDKYQILHLDGLCNECGNCETFCPYQGKPYKDKFTLFWTEEDFENSSNDGIFILNGNRIKLRILNKAEYIQDVEIENLSYEFKNILNSVVKYQRFLT